MMVRLETLTKPHVSKFTLLPFVLYFLLFRYGQAHASENILVDMGKINAFINKNNAFAFVIIMHKRENFDILNKEVNDRVTSGDYVLVYTPHQSRVNNIWVLFEKKKIEGRHRIIGQGGEITYLKSDLYDSPGFDANNTEPCHKFKLFPQRRVQSCKAIDCRESLHLSGVDGSPSFTVLQGLEGWHILHDTDYSDGSVTCLFKTGMMFDLLEMGDRDRGLVD